MLKKKIIKILKSIEGFVLNTFFITVYKKVLTFTNTVYIMIGNEF